jgi:homoserine kinase type II
VNTLPDSPPGAVLSHFAARAGGLSWRRVGGGFSGACVWRGEGVGVPRVALKAWPPGVAAEHVRQVHAWLERAAHLAFVPAVYAGEGGVTAFVHAGCVWECCLWQPGSPITAPAADEVDAACEAAAKLHLAWSAEASRGRCPGVRNRLRILAEAEPLLRAGPGALPAVTPELDPLLRRGLAAAARLAPDLALELRTWANREFTLHPCVRDLRGEHVLFEGGRVAGVVDYGAAAVDHPAVDLARLFVDYAPAENDLFSVGLAAYRRVRGSSEAPDDFVRLLVRSGVAGSVVGWLVRLVVRREAISDPSSTRARLARLVALAQDM